MTCTPTRKKPNSHILLRVGLITWFGLCSALASAESTDSGLRTNETLYQNPFDLASGGASLTRATQEGVLFSNPSLTAFGQGFLRWIFFRTTFHVGADASDLVYELVQKGDFAVSDELLQRALKTPIHFGMDLSGGAIFANAGVGAFFAARADIEGREFGTIGLPELRTRAMGYGGTIASGATQFRDILAIGAAVRYQGNAEINKSFGLLEVTEGEQLVASAQEALKWGLGLGIDLGMTLQYRSRYFDMRLAATINDVGNTRFTGKMNPWLQTVNSGVGVTLHNPSSALHCAYDLRDLEGSYKEHWTKRSYAGCKFVLNSRIGAGIGLYQGWPTFGVVLNAVIIRIEAGTYTKELGSQVGARGRRVYFLAIGGEIP